MIFKDIETDQEWSDAMVLRNKFNWCHPTTVAESKSMFELSRTTRNDDRHIGIDQGSIVYYGGVVHNRNAEGAAYWFSIYVDPHTEHSQGYYREAIIESVRRIQAFGGNSAMIEARGEYPWIAETLKQEGFEPSMKAPFSCLDVTQTNYQSHPNVISFAEFLERHPEDGLHKIWRLEMDIASDLPLPYPFKETPYETFAKSVMDPEIDLHSKFLHFADGELQGMSQLWPSKVDSKLAVNGLTGVRREYRRKGIASRMKQHSASWAKEQGIEKIFTDNEENNPMYQLNLQLGFRHLFDYVVYSKPC
jgi:GNAT superfamily N-acetyltransferase